jgi:site-specific recombinase XerD
VPKKPSSEPPARVNRNNWIEGTVESIPGYPSKLKIGKVHCSKYWWVRVFVNGRYRMSTLKTEVRKEAINAAKLFYEQVLVQNHTGFSGKTKSRTFAAVGAALVESQKLPGKERRYNDDRIRFTKELLPYFAEKDVGEITNADIVDLVKTLREGGKSAATVNHYLIVLRKILNYAADNRLISAIPNFPRVQGRTTLTPRDYFEQKEYEKLVKTIESEAKRETKVRGVQITLEFKYLVQFMVNAFIRPSDLRVLRHSHVAVMENKEEQRKGDRYFLLLKHPATKTTSQEVVTMPAAHGVYQDLKVLQKKRKFAKPTDFVFFPEYTNRNTMIAVAGRIFSHCVKKAKLNQKGLKHTLYSLRHTAIMYRLLLGNVNTLELAKNARTSQAMIDKHYASRLTPLMAVKSLHSFR